MTIQLDTKTIVAAAKSKLVKIKTYTTYDLAAKLVGYEEAYEACTKAQEGLRVIKEDINGFLAFAGEKLLPDTDKMPQADLIERLKEVMPTLPSGGANGKEIASRAGANVTSNDISELYWKDGQTTLKKAKKEGKVQIGIQTKYKLAVEGDLDEINKDKEEEKAMRTAQKSKASNSSK